MDLNTKSILMEDQQAVERLREQYGQTCSSHAFPSLYLWKEVLGLSILLQPDLYAVKCTRQGKNAWFFPCGSRNAVREFLKEGMKEPDFTLCYMRPGDVKWVNRQFPGIWDFCPCPESAEYLYDVPGHRELKGKTYANMRTQVHKVEREYEPRSELIDRSNLGDALSVLEEWRRKRQEEDRWEPEYENVDVNALLLRKKLGIWGVILYLNDRPAAVTAGFCLSRDTFDIMVAKSISTAQGVSYYGRRELFRRLSCPLVNMEEDLGIPGLRRMKTGMRPVGMNEMWKGWQR